MLPPICVDAAMNHNRAKAGSRRIGRDRVVVMSPILPGAPSQSASVESVL